MNDYDDLQLINDEEVARQYRDAYELQARGYNRGYIFMVMILDFSHSYVDSFIASDKESVINYIDSVELDSKNKAYVELNIADIYGNKILNTVVRYMMPGDVLTTRFYEEFKESYRR